MIILKILLFILLAVLGIVFLVLICPVGGELSFIEGKLKFRVKLWIINVMDSEGGGILGWLKKRKKKSKPKKSKPVKNKKNKKKKSVVDEDYYVSEAMKEIEQTPEADVEDKVSTDAASEADDSAAYNTVSDAADEASAEEEIADDSAAADAETFDKAEKKSKKKKSKKNKSEDDDEDKGKTLVDKIELLLGLLQSAGGPIKKIFKGFRFSDVYIDFIIADEDAYDCAIKYGRFSGIVYNGLATLSRIFTVRLETIDIQPGFGLKKGRWDAAFKLSFRAGTVVIAGLWFLITYIFRVFIPDKFRKRKAKRSAAVQK